MFEFWNHGKTGSGNQNKYSNLKQYFIAHPMRAGHNFREDIAAPGVWFEFDRLNGPDSQ
jgi:hypothetical protein